MVGKYIVEFVGMKMCFVDQLVLVENCFIDVSIDSEYQKIGYFCCFVLLVFGQQYIVGVVFY